MSLKTAQVRATVGVTDLDRAAQFYEGALGLEPIGEPNPDMPVRIYACGGGTQLQVYATENAGPSTATAVSWSDPDHDTTIDALIAAGVSFDGTDLPDTDARGVHIFGEHRVAWCKDPDGNVIAIDNGGDPC